MTADTAIPEARLQGPAGVSDETNPPGLVDSPGYLEIYYSVERIGPPPGEPTYYHHLWV